MHVVVNMSSLPVYKKYRISSLLCIFETSVMLFLCAVSICRFKRKQKKNDLLTQQLVSAGEIVFIYSLYLQGARTLMTINFLFSLTLYLWPRYREWKWCTSQSDHELLNYSLTQLHWAWYFTSSYKLKYWKIMIFFTGLVRHSGVVFVLLINVKMPIIELLKCQQLNCWHFNI